VSKGTVNAVYFDALNECLVHDQLQRLSFLFSNSFVPFLKDVYSFYELRNKLLFLKK